jgi:transcriptional regulator with XRE-family HTH domain
MPEGGVMSSYDKALAKLNEVRRQQGVSVRALAEQFGVTPVTMSNWLRHGTSAERFFAIADALGCNLLLTPPRTAEQESASRAAQEAYVRGSQKPCCESDRVLAEVRKLVAE